MLVACLFFLVVYGVGISAGFCPGGLLERIDCLFCFVS